MEIKVFVQLSRRLSLRNLSFMPRRYLISFCIYNTLKTTIFKLFKITESYKGDITKKVRIPC